MLLNKRKKVMKNILISRQQVKIAYGGSDETRTRDLLRDRQAL